ncbi:DUF6227 family protein, partial [Streptomyces harbinensis]|uniref:DUF6227 family protein n=1 Tax=Streptomyces harbinensis TaxID=1176198 RepID=UPI003F695FDC
MCARDRNQPSYQEDSAMTDQPEAGAAARASNPFGVLDVRVPAPRGYPGQDSSRHARRLLGRAENPDRPGEDILRLLL